MCKMICRGRCHHCTHGSFIHSPSLSLAPSFPRRSLFGVWLILQPLSLWVISVSVPLADATSCEIWLTVIGTAMGWPTSCSSSLQALLWPSHSLLHQALTCTHKHSNEHRLCRSDGKRPYMERRSLQCLERKKRCLAEGGDEEHEHDCVWQADARKGNSTEQACCSDLHYQILKRTSNSLHYAIVSSSLWMWLAERRSNSTGTFHC